MLLILIQSLYPLLCSTDSDTYHYAYGDAPSRQASVYSASIAEEQQPVYDSVEASAPQEAERS